MIRSPRPVDTLWSIETPENVRLSFRLAGPWSRGGAYLIDVVMRIGIVWAFVFYVLPFVAMGPPDLGGGLILLLLFLLEWCYGWFFEAFWEGRTPGKRLVGLRVLRSGGYPIGFYEAMVRNLLRGADVLPVFYGIGLISMVSTRRFQRLGDLVADTIVVEEEAPRLRGGLPLLAGVLPFDRTEIAAGRRPLERTLHVVDRLFRRAASFESERVDEIASVLARPLAERIGYTGTEHTKSPSRFLLRVLASFGDERRTPDDDLAEATVVATPGAGSTSSAIRSANEASATGAPEPSA